MRSGHAIIGASYGDEGKGLMTDYFASQCPEDSLVVRFNGGAQAGHTVVDPVGRRHVFSHFGAGSFLNVPTYLSEYFIVNPMVFFDEWVRLIMLGAKPILYIHGDAFVSTPLDILINQVVETYRGLKRHGSCGVGINETVTRCLDSERYLTRAKDLLKPHVLEQKLEVIRKEWFKKRLAHYGINYDEALDTVPYMNQLLNSENLHQVYMEDVKRVLDAASIVYEPPVFDNVIFEGAQGLLLDEGRQDLFPHVTRSRTGSTNVFQLCKQFGIDDLTVTYVTRSYITRHGAGPLLDEADFSFPDRTNVTNAFQGSLRFAPMNIGLLADSIERDLKTPGRPTIFKANLAVTCLDQLDECPDSNSLPVPVIYRSYGETRGTITAKEAVKV